MQKHFFLHTLITLAFILLLISTLTACTRPDSGTVIPAVGHQQLFQLQGKIQQGPSAGLNLSGEMRTAIDSAGRLHGALAPESGSAITVTGQIDGQAIHLSFDLGNDAAVLGVGTLQHSIDNPQGTAGGLLTGPQPGDSGDWFARWTTITIPVTPAPTKPAANNSDLSPLSTLMTYLALFLLLMVGLVVYTIYKMSGSIANMPATFSKFLRASTGRTRHPPSPFPRHSIIPSVRASAQAMEPERWPDEATLPLAQFATTYAHGDDHYDLSFSIAAPRGEFLGECGVGISATVDSRQLQAGTASNVPSWLESTATQSAAGKSKSVTALEVWIFDKNDIRTITKVLRSAGGFYNPSQRSSRDPVNDVLVIEPDQTVVLETETLRLRVKVIAVEYLADVMASSSVFKQVSLKLAVWVKDHA